MATGGAPLTPPSGPQPTAIQTTKPFVNFKPSDVPPSQFLYLQQNDNILIKTITNSSGQNLSFQYRFLTPQGEIKEGQFVFTPPVGPATTSFTLGECWLLSFGIQRLGAGVVGNWAHIQVGITRTAALGLPVIIHSIIWQGYVYNATFNGWPGTPSKETYDGAGMIRTILGTTPGVGNEIFETVLLNRRWTVQAIFLTLTTSAAVANRTPALTVDDGGFTFFVSPNPIAQPASTASFYSTSQVQQGAASLNTTTALLFPLNLQLKANYRIRTSTTNLQAGDQWSAPVYTVVEWASSEA